MVNADGEGGHTGRCGCWLGAWRYRGVLVKLLNSGHDIRISAEPAEVSAYPFSNLAFAIGMSLVQASGCGTELSSGTEAALESIVSDKSVLQRAELTVLSKSFDRSDFVALVHHRKR